MKKFFLIVIMMLLTIPVYGLENSTIKYKYYRLNKVMGPILYKDEVNDEFPLIDLENPIEGEMSEFLTEKPLDKEGREIFEYDGFEYLEIPKINSIEVKMYEGFDASDVSVVSTDGEINFESDIDGYIPTGGSGNFWFDSGYDLDDLIVNLSTGDISDFYFLTIYFKCDGVTVSELYVSALSNYTHQCFGSTSVLNRSTFKKLYFKEKQNNDSLIYNGSIKLYQFKDTKYQSYKLEKEYYPEYLSEPFEDYIYRDDNDYIMDVTDNKNKEDDITEITVSNNEILDDTNFDKENLYNTEIEYDNFSEKESLTQSEANFNTATPDGKVKKPTQYQNVLKIDDKKTVSNKINYNKSYFLLVILIILLLIMIKVRKHFKKYYR